MKENEIGGACSTHVTRNICIYRALVGRTERKKWLGRLRHIWKDIMKWILKA
jgi:hypothetical protein